MIFPWNFYFQNRSSPFLAWANTFIINWGYLFIIQMGCLPSSVFLILAPSLGKKKQLKLGRLPQNTSFIHEDGRGITVYSARSGNYCHECECNKTLGWYIQLMWKQSPHQLDLLSLSLCRIQAQFQLQALCKLLACQKHCHQRLSARNESTLFIHDNVELIILNIGAAGEEEGEEEATEEFASEGILSEENWQMSITCSHVHGVKATSI